MIWQKRGFALDLFILVLTNVLASFYQEFFASVISAFLFMYLYMIAKKNGGFRNAFRVFGRFFKSNKEFRYVFYLAFYTAMILYRTLLCRSLWNNPLSDVMGTWGLYDDAGNLSTQIIENLLLFVPFTYLVFWAKEKGKDQDLKYSEIVIQSFSYSFIFSLSIELLQLLLKVGTFQLSDLFFNTLGGMIGGMLYMLCGKRRIRKASEQTETASENNEN